MIILNCKKFISSVLSYIPARRENMNLNKFIILLYHSIGQSQTDDYLKLKVSSESFDRQMKYLLENDYKVVTLGEMLGNINLGNYNYKKKTVCITFDDGFSDNLELAVPILKKYGYCATFFISLNYLYRKFKKKKYWEKWDYLNAEGIKGLSAQKMEIGSHSCSHQILTWLDGFTLRKEISDSKKGLENILINEITLFSYPHGIFNDKIMHILKEEGYQAACSSITGVNTDKTDLFELKRIEIRGDDSLSGFELKLKGCYNWTGYFQKIRLKLRR